MIFRGDDVFPGKTVLDRGRLLSSQDIGALAAIGRTRVPVVKKLRVGIVSTGDGAGAAGRDPRPGAGERRERPTAGRHAPALLAVEVTAYGIVRDDEAELSDAVRRAAAENDAVLLSGGSSAGVKDAACRIIESMGELLLHGIAMKPGKPAILGKAGKYRW